MYEESISELDEIDSEEQADSLVLEARYKTYRDAKAWESAKAMAELLYERNPRSFSWCKNLVESMTECGDPTGGLQLLQDEVLKFSKLSEYVFAVARQYALLGEVEDAKLFVKRAIKMDSSLKAEFLDDPAFDEVWDSF